MAIFDTRYLPQQPLLFSDTSPTGKKTKKIFQARNAACAPKSVADERVLGV